MKTTDEQYQLGESTQQAATTSDEERLLDALTPRQRDILKLIAEGHTTKGIAFALHVSPKTVVMGVHRTRDCEGYSQ